MDARPQRPVRAMKVFDENALPAVKTQKTIHQRNKSSPALSTLSQAGGLKVAAKRTAFGDLSNTTNFLRPSKDDSATGSKFDFKLKENLLPIQEKKSITLQKPAQRPVSVIGLRNLVNNVTNLASQPIAKQPLADLPRQTIPPLGQPAPARTMVTKKSTAVFKDLEPSKRPLPEPPSTTVHKPSTAPIAPVHRELTSKPVEEAPVANDTEQKSRTASIYSDAPETREEPQASSSAEIKSDVGLSASDGIYIDERGEVQVYNYRQPDEYRDERVENMDNVRPAQTNNHCSTKVPLSDAPAGKLNGAYAEPARKQKLAPVSEPEEYWEEEEPVEVYDEEGYVTARSFKSRGDNTTGGATTVLFPKQTQKVKTEIALAKELIESAKTVEELEDEAWDTTMVAEYGDEIFQYMKELEIKMLPNAHYMDNQAEIQWSMRAVLMDWIVQVHHRFNLLPETLFLCVNYIDRFLSCKVVSLGKLQLVGATAIFIAAKYEEIDCPSVQEIVYMVDGGYTIDEILKAERFMLTMLQFELGWPGPMSFLRRISKADDYDLETRTLAKYFLEITIMDERFVGSPPSFVAAGAHCLARMMLRKGNWSPAHVYYSNYTYSQLFSLVLLMIECCEEPRKHHAAVYEKYQDKRYKKASPFAENEMRKGFQLLPVSAGISTIHQPIHDHDPYAIHPPQVWVKT